MALFDHLARSTGEARERLRKRMLARSPADPVDGRTHTVAVGYAFIASGKAPPTWSAAPASHGVSQGAAFFGSSKISNPKVRTRVPSRAGTPRRCDRRTPARGVSDRAPGGRSRGPFHGGCPCARRDRQAEDATRASTAGGSSARNALQASNLQRRNVGQTAGVGGPGRCSRDGSPGVSPSSIHRSHRSTTSARSFGRTGLAR